jgi:uncharacterized protein (DUF58 family)
VLLADLLQVGPEPAPARSVTIRRQRVFILPTGQGLAFATALLGMLVGAVNYGANLGHLLTFLLGATALVSALHAHRNLVGLTLRAARIEPVFAGEEALFRVCLEGPDGQERPALAVAYRRPGAGSPRRAPWQEAAVSLPAGEGRCVELRVPAGRRGRLPLGRLRVRTRYPLGLFRAWAPLELDAVCVVYPRPAGHLPLPAAAGVDAEPGRASEGAAEEDFSGLRDYARGDSPRRIHWRVAARGHAVPVKVFTGEAGDAVRLRWEAAGPGDTEARLSQLARWLVEAQGRGLGYALELPGQSIPPGRGEAHLARCLGALALFEPAHG